MVLLYIIYIVVSILTFGVNGRASIDTSLTVPAVQILYVSNTSVAVNGSCTVSRPCGLQHALALTRDDRDYDVVMAPGTYPFDILPASGAQQIVLGNGVLKWNSSDAGATVIECVGGLNKTGEWPNQSYGGFIPFYLARRTRLHVTGLVFRYCGWGVVSTRDTSRESEIYVDKCIFEQGGAGIVSTGNIVDIRNSTFARNTPVYYNLDYQFQVPSAVFSLARTLTIQDSVFEGNVVQQQETKKTKTVVYVLADTNLGPVRATIDHCRFTRNTGMVLLSEGNLTVTNSVFELNYNPFLVTSHLIYVFREVLVKDGATSIYVDIQNSTFLRNQYSDTLVRVDSGNRLEIGYSTFSHNDARGHFGRFRGDLDGSLFYIHDCVILDDKLSDPTISGGATAGNKGMMLLERTQLYAALQVNRFGNQPILEVRGHLRVDLRDCLFQAPGRLIVVQGGAVVASRNTTFRPQDSVSGTPGLLLSPAITVEDVGSFYSMRDTFARMNWIPGQFSPGAFLRVTSESPGAVEIRGTVFDLRYLTTGVVIDVRDPSADPGDGCSVQIEESVFYFGDAATNNSNGISAVQTNGPTELTISSCEFTGTAREAVLNVLSPHAQVFLVKNTFIDIKTLSTTAAALVDVFDGVVKPEANDFVNFGNTAFACRQRSAVIMSTTNRFVQGRIDGGLPSAFYVTDRCVTVLSNDVVCSSPEGEPSVVCTGAGTFVNGSVSVDPVTFQCPGSEHVIFAPGAVPRHVLLCPDQPVVIGLDQDDVTDIFASTRCLAQGDYANFLGTRLGSPPKYMPRPSAGFPRPNTTCQGATRTLSLHTPMTNTSNSTQDPDAEISVRSGFQSATNDQSVIVLTSSTMSFATLDVRLTPTSVFVPNTLIRLPREFLGWFMFTDRDYTFTVTFRNQFGDPLALETSWADRATLVFKFKSGEPQSFAPSGKSADRTSLLFSCKTASKTGTYSLYTVLIAESSPAVQVTLVWIGWVIIACSVVSLSIVIPVGVCVWRRVRRTRTSLLNQQVKLVERLLKVEQKDIEDAHTRYLAYHEVTRLPYLFFIDNSLYVHAVCESPGHWHLIDNSRSASPLPRHVAEKLKAHQQSLREYVREFPPQQPDDNTGYTRTVELLRDNLPWFAVPHPGSKPASRVVLSSLTTTHPTTTTPSSRSEATDYIKLVLDDYIMPLFRHPSYHHKLRRVLLRDDKYCWSCPDHGHALARPYDLSIGARSLMTRLAPNVSSFDINVSNQNTPFRNEIQEIIDMVFGELSRQEWSRHLNVKRIRVLHNRYLTTAFRQRDRILSLATRHRLAHPWPEDGNQALRKAMSDALRSHLVRICDDTHVSLHDLSNLDLVWHAANGGEETIETIAQTGFMSLSLLNTGWYGRGVYFTHYPEYAEYYAPVAPGEASRNRTAQGERMLVLSWVILGQTYPVVSRIDRRTDPEHDIHGGFPGHDSHYTIVRPGGAPMDVASNSDIQQGVVDLQTGQFDEIVVWQENQILPQFVVYYQDQDG